MVTIPIKTIQQEDYDSKAFLIYLREISDITKYPKFLRNKIEKTIGKPYKFNCFDLSGFDCYTLVFYLYSLIGIQLPKINISKFALRQNAKLIKQNSLHFEQVLYSQRKPYDILLMQSSDSIDAHIALVLDKSCFIHIDKTHPVRIEQFIGNINAAQIKKVYRWLF